MEKIEKLEEFNWVSGRDAITIALCNTIIRKQNEIIDHLNSQDQEGYEKRIRIRGELSGETEHIKAHKELTRLKKELKEHEELLRYMEKRMIEDGWTWDFSGILPKLVKPRRK